MVCPIRSSGVLAARAAKPSGVTRPVPAPMSAAATAALIGAGTGLITPLGFAALAASTPEERMGQTMGTAELGRELGDAGGPLLVGAIATVSTLAFGYAALAALLAAGSLLAFADSRN